MMWKLIGAVFIIFGCGGIGFLIAAGIKKEERYIKELTEALEFMTSELKYRMTPLPELMARAAACTSGDLFKALGKMSLGAEIEYIRSERIMAKLGGILVESKSEINGIFVARTEGAAIEEKDESPLTNSDT